MKFGLLLDSLLIEDVKSVHLITIESNNVKAPGARVASARGTFTVASKSAFKDDEVNKRIAESDMVAFLDKCFRATQASAYSVVNVRDKIACFNEE